MRPVDFAIGIFIAFGILWVAGSFMCRIAPQVYGDTCRAKLHEGGEDRR